MRVHTNLLPKGVELPYAIKVDNPIATIGIFGDSFAELAEFKNYPGVNEFHHESSWIYFLSNILNMNCETFGISQCSNGDIFHTLLLNTKKYDYYIIICTFPPRENIFATFPYDIRSCKMVKKFIEDKKVIFIYWDERHKLFDFEKPFMISDFHMTNANKNEPYSRELQDAKPNKLDQLDGLHHMSSRGNLLFALKLSKLFIANYLKN